METPNECWIFPSLDTYIQSGNDLSINKFRLVIVGSAAVFGTIKLQELNSYKKETDRMRNSSYLSRGVLRLIREKINNQCWCKSVQLQGLYWCCKFTPAEGSVLTAIWLS